MMTVLFSLLLVLAPGLNEICFKGPPRQAIPNRPETVITTIYEVTQPDPGWVSYMVPADVRFDGFTYSTTLGVCYVVTSTAQAEKTILFTVMEAP